ncbi:MAG TPA: glycosyltransferase family 9 protein [Humisphaera sp.]|jgi:ADP-heptose:LPS heptosyltransferase|nr:glycosyltransferase family 9 protein [Humisphaera sp.]
MSPGTVRIIDVWLGRPICFALTMLRKVGGIFGARAAQRPVKRVLLIKMIEQGATVLAYRAIARAVERFGAQNVYFWVFEENRFILDLLELVPRENVLVIRTRKPVLLFWDLLRTAWMARKLKIDATVDMEFFSRASAILAFLSGAHRRVGLHRFTSEGPYRGDLLTHRVQYNPFIHTAAAYYLMVEAIDADPSQVPLMKTPIPRIDFSAPRFVPREAEIAKVQAALDRLAGRHVQRPIVLLNPNASDLLPLRRWPTEKFIELGKRIVADFPEVTLGITGAPSEAEAAGKIAREISPNALTLAGQTTLRELIVLYTMADVLVTNDSGPGHFSSMTAITSIVLFGPETPAVFGPLGPGTRVVRTDLACSPCVNTFNHRFSPCNDNVCMQMIEVDEVYNLVRDRLAGKPRLELTIMPPALSTTEARV